MNPRLNAKNTEGGSPDSGSSVQAANVALQRPAIDSGASADPAQTAPAGQIVSQVKTADGSHFDEPRIIQSVRMRFNPIRGLTPDLLSQYLDQFRIGYLRNCVITWEAMERRDYQVKVCRDKRLKSVGRHGWEVVTVGNVPTDQEAMAEEQKRVLEFFYNNITVTDALQPDVSGGFSLLCRQMLDAVGKQFSVHEVVWKPAPDGLGAELRWCPLYWFETTRGRLRFLQNEFAIWGDDMPDGEWLVTVGDGLMEATSVCYIYKQLPLKSWLNYLDKFGMPGVLGKTDSPYGSKQWTAMEDAVQAFAQDFAAVCNRSEELSLVELKSQSGGGLFDVLVEKIDRAITTLWRGGDLGTMGATQSEAKGVTLQEGETESMDTDDCQLIEETLGIRLSRKVLEYHFGVGCPILVYLKIRTTETDQTDQNLRVDQFLLNAGAPLGVQATLERYNRPVPDEGEELLRGPAQPDPNDPNAKEDSASRDDDEKDDQDKKDDERSGARVPPSGGSPETSNAADALTEKTRRLLAAALSEQFAAIVAKGKTLLQIEDEEAFRKAAAGYLQELDAFELECLQHPGAVADVLVRAQVAALANGLEDARKTRLKR